MEMKIQVMFFWVLTPCSDMVGYHHFGRSCYLYLYALSQGYSLRSEDRGSKVLRNVGFLSHHTQEDHNLNYRSQLKFSEPSRVLLLEASQPMPSNANDVPVKKKFQQKVWHAVWILAVELLLVLQIVCYNFLTFLSEFIIPNHNT